MQNSSIVYGFVNFIVNYRESFLYGEGNTEVFVQVLFISQVKEMTTYIDETLKRIQGHAGVVGTIIMTSDGAVIKTTLDQKTAGEYSCRVADICEKTRSMIRDMDSSNDLTFLRLRSKKNEMMIVPDKDYILVTIKAPTE